MSSPAGIPKDAEVICLDGTSDDEEDRGSSGKIRSSGTFQQKRRAKSLASSNKSNNSNNDKNDDVICLLDSDDSDDEVLIVEPPVAKSLTKQPKPARAAPNKRPSTKSTKRKTNVTQDDDDDSDDDFLLQCKPSGLGRKAPPKEASLSSKAPVGTPLGGKAVTAVSGKTPSSTANSTGGKTENPYLKKKTPSSGSSSSTASDQKMPASTTVQTSVAAAAAGSARKRLQTPISNPYAKKTPSSSKTSSSTPSSASPGVFYPQLRAGHKLYSDIRPNLVLALWKFSRSRLVQDSYNQAKFDKYITRLVDLAVTNRDFPIRTMGEYAFRQLSPATTGAGIMERDKYERFKDDMESTPQMTASIPIDASGTSRQYFTIAEACLVAMKEEIVSRWKRNQREGRSGQQDNSQPPLLFPTQPEDQTKILSQKEYWISLEELIPKIDARLRPECPGRLKRDKDPDNGAEHYLKASTRSAEYKQIEKLTKTQTQIENGAMVGPEMGFLKSHSLRKQRHFELTALGYSKAHTLRTRTFPAPVGHYRCSNLERVDPKYDKICLAVDLREGGGQTGKKTLHEMCNVLDKVSIPYFVGHLSIGDYCFFSGNLLCPILVERKSVQDLAQSIHEGRMFRQKRRMYQGQFVFGYNNCRIAFIIEGKLEKQQVTGGFVGAARFGVMKERFEEEMKKLEAEGFDVLRTTRAENSMFELNRWAQRVAKEVQSGKLKLQYTYNEFIGMVKEIPDQTDFSRMAKYHASEKKKATVERQRDENTISLLDSDDEGIGAALSQEDGGVKGLKPSNLDTKFAKKRKRPLVQTNNGQQTAAAKRPKLEEEKTPEDEYRCLSAAQLKEKCVEFGLKKSGTKDQLIDRLLKPRPPDIYCQRKKLGLYVPARLATSSTALLVAVQIFQDQAPAGQNYLGRTKEELYVLAEGLDIKKDPFSGGTTQTGPYHYDGWASMSKLLEPGDPPLVIKKRVKSKDHFRLSTSSAVSGIGLARAMHRWCHQSNICRCEELGYTYNL